MCAAIAVAATLRTTAREPHTRHLPDGAVTSYQGKAVVGLWSSRGSLDERNSLDAALYRRCLLTVVSSQASCTQMGSRMLSDLSCPVATVGRIPYAVTTDGAETLKSCVFLYPHRSGALARERFSTRRP